MPGSVQVDMRKVNLSVIRPWVAKKIVELVGMEDEVVIEYAMGLLEDESQPVLISYLLLKLQANMFAGARPKKNANQPYRFLDKGDTSFYVSTLEIAHRSPGGRYRYPTHNARRKEGRDA